MSIGFIKITTIILIVIAILAFIMWIIEHIKYKKYKNACLCVPSIGILCFLIYNIFYF